MHGSTEQSGIRNKVCLLLTTDNGTQSMKIPR